MDDIVSLSPHPHGDQVWEFLRVEYFTLRTELLKRAEFRERLLEIALVSAAAVLTINLTGLEFTRTLLLYPVLIMLIALVWLYHGLQMLSLERYLKSEIEAHFQQIQRVSGDHDLVGYETWRGAHLRPLEAGMESRAMIGVFVGVQVLIYGLGLTALPTDPLFGSIGALAIAVTLGILIGYPR